MVLFSSSVRSSAFDICMYIRMGSTGVWLNWNLKARVNHWKINIWCVCLRPFWSNRRPTFDFGIASDLFLPLFLSELVFTTCAPFLLLHLISFFLLAQAFRIAHKLFSIAHMAMPVASINSYIISVSFFADYETVTFCTSSSFIIRPGSLIASLNSAEL